MTEEEGNPTVELMPKKRQKEMKHEQKIEGLSVDLIIRDDIAMLVATEFDGKCISCGAPIYTGKALRCHCGAIMHHFCVDPHILLAHRPENELIDVVTESVYDNGKFVGHKSVWKRRTNP